MEAMHEGKCMRCGRVQELFSNGYCKRCDDVLYGNHQVIKPYDPRIKWTLQERDKNSKWQQPYKYPTPEYEQPCLVEDFLRRNPGKICMIACHCPKCSIRC